MRIWSSPSRAPLIYLTFQTPPNGCALDSTPSTCKSGVNQTAGGVEELEATCEKCCLRLNVAKRWYNTRGTLQSAPQLLLLKPAMSVPNCKDLPAVLRTPAPVLFSAHRPPTTQYLIFTPPLPPPRPPPCSSDKDGTFRRSTCEPETPAAAFKSQ